MNTGLVSGVEDLTHQSLPLQPIGPFELLIDRLVLVLQPYKTFGASIFDGRRSREERFTSDGLLKQASLRIATAPLHSKKKTPTAPASGCSRARPSLSFDDNAMVYFNQVDVDGGSQRPGILQGKHQWQGQIEWHLHALGRCSWIDRIWSSKGT
jgi:hypothetical protein